MYNVGDSTVNQSSVAFPQHYFCTNFLLYCVYTINSCIFVQCGRFNCQSIKCSISTALFLYKFSTVLRIHNKFFVHNFSFSYIHNKEILLKSFTYTNIAFTLFFFFLILLAVGHPGGDVRLQFGGQCKRHPLHFSVISPEIGSILCGIFLIIFPSKEIKDFTVAKLL